MKKTSAETSAFLKSGGVEFNGVELKPFTPQRQAVATEMGMTWPWVKGGDEVELKVRIKIPTEELKKIPKAKRPADGSKEVTITHYKQSYKDSLIALWLCSQAASRVDRAERKPEEAMTEAWAWAKKIGMNQNTELAGEALSAWIQITNELAGSKGEPIPKDGDEKPEDEDAGEL